MTATSSRSGVSARVQLMRPSHWLKNVFVFAPLVYSKTLFQFDYLLPAIEAFGAFCLISSAVYIFNDIADREADAEHPKKRFRPIPSGAVSPTSAWIQLAVVLLSAGLLLSALPWRAGLLIGIYLVINAAYSLGLKHVVLLDIFIIAAGFMLRVLTGAYAIDVPVSNWLVICTLFLSLFLGVAKRRSEINNMERGQSRKVLDDYTPELVRTIMIVSVAGSIMSYTLYTLTDRVVEIFGTDKLIYTVPIVMFGMFRYLYLDEKKQTAENPVAVVARDPSLILTALAWGVVSLAVIYWEM
ncbi:MAG: decaprenyl-phosphate phosphoribosyltransferase [Candidatus Kapaibacterium sp.]